MAYELVIDKTVRISFGERSDFADWVREEIKTWQFILGNRDETAHTLNSLPDKLISQLQKFRLAQNVNQALSELQNLIDQGTYIPATSKLGRFISESRRTDRHLPVRILWLALNPEDKNIPMDVLMLQAFVTLNDFRYEKTLSERSRTTDSLIKRLEDLVSEEETHAQGRREALDKAVTEGQNRFDEKIELLEKKLALHAPIDYWRGKAENHRNATGVLASAFVVYSATALYYLASFILGFDGGIQGFIASWKDAGLGAVASFAGLIGIGMIIARVLYRLFASQLHLWNDARERVTMIQTYLALAAEGHTKDAFLGALMQRLFSPSVDGIVKSELGSVGPLEGVMKQLSPK